jgi:RNA polymerase sigma-70 factor (ECF subfamily)
MTYAVGPVPPEETTLLAAVGQGDEAAFRTLYRRYTPRLLRLMLRLMGEPADADDAVQETWLRGVRGLARFRAESAFYTWLAGIGIRVAAESLRRRAHWVSWDDASEPARSPAVDGGERIDLERALAALPDAHRVVIVLHDVEGYTHEEIAARLGVAPGTSKSQLFRARRALRARLNGQNEVAPYGTA